MEVQNNALRLLFQNFIQYLVEKFWFIIIVCKEEKKHKHIWVCDLEAIIK